MSAKSMPYLLAVFNALYLAGCYSSAQNTYILFLPIASTLSVRVKELLRLRINLTLK